MKNKGKLILSTSLLAAFVLWTFLVSIADVKAIGPDGSQVGFSTLNGAFHRLTGVNMTLYGLTDLFSVIPFGIIAGFALLGLIQWIKRKSLKRVDRDILVLGGLYVVTLAVFLLFEVFPVNYRPVLIEGLLEASYPSSTTMLCMCVLPTGAMQSKKRIRNTALRRAVLCSLTAFTVFMVAGRAISGVHWLTDIIGGALFSGAAVSGYRLAAENK